MSGISYFFRPEKGSQDAIGPVYGPFQDYLQLTYESLTAGPDGREVAAWREENFGWEMCCNLPVVEEGDAWPPEGWSDIVIWAEELT